MSEIMIMGAGMVGISTALELQSRGHTVTVVDRGLPGQETSHGNAGLIQAEAAEPYAMPRNPRELCDILLGRTNDILWSFGGVLGQWPALWQYYRFSHPRRYQALCTSHAHLIRTASADHDRWIKAADAGDLIARNGYLSVFRNPRRFEAMARDLERLDARYGIAATALDGGTVRRMEPLYTSTPAGGVHWPEVWSCSDPGGLVTRYASCFRERGGRILGGDALNLQREGRMWQVNTDQGRTQAEHAVIALGPWSPQLLKQLGYQVRMVMKHGAHRMYDRAPALQRPIFDAEHGVVLSSMRAGLRMTCGVALEAAGRVPDTRQLSRAARGVRNYMDPGMAQAGKVWRGTRPFLPDMLPLVGAAPRHDQLWFHFGHGHQGFTLGPTTARHLADMMDGDTNSDVTALMPENRGKILT
ncbi:FAD-dependent oxidoreductase [Paracoccus sp. Z330]|uniref:FAD-dependent oxidoreductase n=1 Tax=Paracoccus onchidii TaxID=3017813 RepID=A0ABT4ZK79_9RHOB|nr:FAD-dependent oxidoreductase [Paracoccus onchidii]MDB6179130.1 FAD-dependent oxidoreductase [Paracoccus onchidii]